MINNIQMLGYGIIGLAIVIGAGSVVLDKFGNAVDGTSNTTVQYLLTQLGTTGLAGWIPAIIAFVIGMLFLGYFMTTGKGRNY